MSVNWMDPELTDALLNLMSALERQDASLRSIHFTEPAKPKRSGSLFGVELWKES